MIIKQLSKQTDGYSWTVYWSFFLLVVYSGILAFLTACNQVGKTRPWWRCLCLKRVVFLSHPCFLYYFNTLTSLIFCCLDWCLVQVELDLHFTDTLLSFNDALGTMEWGIEWRIRGPKVLRVDGEGRGVEDGIFAQF